MRTLLADLRFAFRMLAKRPGFTSVAVLALALGIGANTAVFSVIRGVVLRPLAYRDPGTLVVMWEKNLRANALQERSSPGNFKDWNEQNQSFEAMAAYAGGSAVLTESGEPELLTGATVTSNYFDLLGVPPALGREFNFASGENDETILSYELWERRFGRDPQIIGRKLRIGDMLRTVIGVMPQGFRAVDVDGAKPPEMWRVFRSTDLTTERRNDFLRVLARRKKGVSIEQARTDMAVITARLTKEYPEMNAPWTLRVIPLAEAMTRDVRTPLWLLLGAAAVLLLIACANVANLSLARSAERRREFAIRAALGGGSVRLFRQLITESLALGLLGGAAGFLLAMWAMTAMLTLGSAYIPRASEVRLDPWVMLFALAAACVTAVLFGVLPAAQATRVNLNEALKSAGRGTVAGRGRMRSALVVAEVGLSLLLMVATGLLLRSFWRLESVQLGFEPSRLLTASVRLPQGRAASFLNELLDRIERLPGVTSAAAISGAPMTGAGHNAFTIEGRPDPAPDTIQDAVLNGVTPGYFRTMGIQLRAGRYFSASDREGTPPVAMISESLARRYFAPENPLGHRIGVNESFYTITGVVADVHDTSVATKPLPQIYVAHAQVPMSRMALEVRASLDPLALVSAVRAELRAMDKDRPLSNVTTEEQLIAENIAPRRFALTLIGLFAGLALLVASIGIYGVISYSVTESTRELGIRMALGAAKSDVLRMVLARGLKMAAIGIVAGGAAALAATRLMGSFLFDVSAYDPVTYLAVSGMFIMVALAACVIPARRATNVDPMAALHYE